MIGNPEVHVIMDDTILSYPKNPPYHPGSEYPFYRREIDRENKLYGIVRKIFHQMVFDIENYDKPTWNFLGSLIKPGNTVLLKPNFISNHNWRFKRGLTDTDSSVAHG